MDAESYLDEAWQLCRKELDDVEEVVDLRDCESSTHFREGRGYSNTTCQTLDILGPECSESSVSSPQNLDVIDGLDLDSVLRALVSAEDSENSEAGGLSALLANTVYIDTYRDDACSDSDSTVPSEEDTALLPPTVAPRVQIDSLRQPQQLQPSLSSVDWPELVQSHRSSACSGYSAGASVESPASASRDRPGHTSLQAGSLEASIQVAVMSYPKPTKLRATVAGIQMSGGDFIFIFFMARMQVLVASVDPKP
ncbi:hypothetical protein AK812_SmicGene26697 [Symbiodinium microadriaticum]|uniref:Uncharacterized protein n=1 Tax=Symbiodinium microadriaticum TaxID=2951 RepID=A0A1Q9D8S5_SYMMI|nr:hypothetical protein AK812_SmicGene26697 [Symbiodinium microadriaticum]